MLEKIREDIEEDVSNITKENRDIIKGYKISEDYKKVYIYFYKEGNYWDLYTSVDNQIRFHIQLYHQFADGGSGKTEYNGAIINFIEG